MTERGFRARFKEFVDDETFTKFVRALNSSYKPTAGLLRYWQERVIESFNVAHPNFTVSQEEVVRELNMCWLHEIDLHPVEIPATRGSIDIPFYKDWRKFPNASQASYKYLILAGNGQLQCGCAQPVMRFSNPRIGQLVGEQD